MSEASPTKPASQALAEAVLFGVSGVLILLALSYAIHGGISPPGPSLNHILSIASMGFLGFFLLGIAIYPDNHS